MMIDSDSKHLYDHYPAGLQLEERLKKYKAIYLLGAGASYPAGLPPMKEMTQDFDSDSRSNRLNLRIEHQEEKITNLKEIVIDLYRQNDLEYLMTILIELGDEQKRSLYMSKYPKIKTFIDDVNKIKSGTQN